jgi:hypothetical protein
MMESVLASRVAEWVAIASVAVGGGLYAGNIATSVEVNTADIANLQPVATEVAKDIATLEERTVQMQQSLNDIKSQQNNILEELRRDSRR